MHTNITVALKANFMLLLCRNFFLNISSITPKFKNFIINKPKNSLFIFLVLNAVFITVRPD